MTNPFPSSLIALRGDLAFRSRSALSRRVFRRRRVLDPRAAGFRRDRGDDRGGRRAPVWPYRWGSIRLVDPAASLPVRRHGGDPRLPFSTPTINRGESFASLSWAAHIWRHSCPRNPRHQRHLAIVCSTRDSTNLSLERESSEDSNGPEPRRGESVPACRSCAICSRKVRAQGSILHIDVTGRRPPEEANSHHLRKGALLIKTLEHPFRRDDSTRSCAAISTTSPFRGITT